MQKIFRFSFALTLLIILCASLFAPQVADVEAKPASANLRDVVISEVAWAGTAANGNDEWLELYNRTNSPINLNGWRIVVTDGSPATINLPNKNIPANGYFLLERAESAVNIPADYVYGGSGNFNNTSEGLTLYDNLNNVIDTANSGCIGCWYGGAGSPDYKSMERVGFTSDTVSDWITNNGVTRNGLDSASNPINGTPRNSRIDLALSVNLISTTGTVPPYDVTYSITITNQGYGTVTNVQVSNSLPVDLTFLSYTSTVGTYSAGVWTVGSLATGTSQTLTINATMNTIGLATVYAEISAVTETDPDSTRNNLSTTEDDDDLIKLGSSILTITNTVNNPNPSIGSNVVFTLNVSNPNALNANNVLVEAPLPAGMSFVSVSSGSYDSVTGIWNIGSLPLGTSTTPNLNITATVFSSTSMTFTAEVSSNEFGNSVESETVSPIPSTQADLTLTQSWNRSTSFSDTALLNITITNQDVTNAATNVQVRSLLPTGLTYVSHTNGQNYNSGTGIWAVGTVLNGSPKTLAITVRVSASGTSTSNFAEIWQVDQFDPDSTPANGDVGEDDSRSVEVPVADLSLTQTSDIAGSNAVFTFRVTNSGPDNATNVKVDNTKLHLAANYLYISDTGGGAYNSGTGIWTIGSLADGATTTLIVTTTIVSPDENWAEVSDVTEVDPDSLPDNNSRVEDDDAASPSADLSLTKIILTPAPYNNSDIDSNVTFRITVTNSGFANATGVEVKDLLPSGLTYVSHTSGQNYNKSTGIWTVGNVPRNTSLYIDITAKVTTIGIRSNYAEVWKSNQSDPDSDPGDGSNVSDDDDLVTITSYRSVIINEIAWSGTAASAEDEWIELYNPSDSAITITNWKIRKNSCGGSGTDYITLSGSISKDSYFLLERTDNSTVSDISANQIYNASQLSDSGEVLYLCDNAGNFIDTANQQGSGNASNPWPQGNDSSTHSSMERKNNSSETDSSWATNDGITKNGLNANGGAIYGTPSKKNSVLSTSSTPTPSAPTATPAPVIVIDPRAIINEIHARPGFDWNQDGREDVFDEFIEIKNLTAIDITLKGWKLDKPNSTSFSLPDVILKPNERIVFYSLETNLLLSDGGETIRLINPSGKIYDAYTYSVAKTEDQSFCRLPDGNVYNGWFEDCIPTPNESNTRKGSVPTSPGGDAESPTCDLPDTIPTDFFIAECRGYGAQIWNPLYWEQLFRIFINSHSTKWESYFE